MRRLSALSAGRTAVLTSLLVAFGLAPALVRAADPSAEVVERYLESLTRGARWLADQQNDDGGFGPKLNPRLKDSSDVGLSAFALYALARVPEPASKGLESVTEKGAKFIVSMQQPDGSFVDPRDPSLKNYKTSVAVLALVELDREKYSDPIDKAVAFIKSQQVLDADNLGYGGLGYGSRDTNPDLSNLQFAVEALRAAGESASSSTFSRVQVFLRKVQNLPGAEPVKIAEATDDKEAMLRRSTGDGGFFYRIIDTRGPVETLDDGSQVFSSYGSMTYAGLKSLLYAQVDKKDPRVQAAFDWISKNFSVKQNPGMASLKDPLSGKQGLFYYYHTMAKALSAYGEPIIEDEREIEHDWAMELGDELVRLQQENGAWKNVADRWLESVETLTTSYALVALTVCREELKSRL